MEKLKLGTPLEDVSHARRQWLDSVGKVWVTLGLYGSAWTSGCVKHHNDPWRLEYPSMIIHSQGVVSKSAKKKMYMSWRRKPWLLTIKISATLSFASYPPKVSQSGSLNGAINGSSGYLSPLLYENLVHLPIESRRIINIDSHRCWVCLLCFHSTLSSTRLFWAVFSWSLLIIICPARPIIACGSSARDQR